MLVEFLRVAFKLSERHACRLIRLSRSSQRYQHRRDGQVALRIRLKELAAARPRYGYLRLHILLRREGWQINRKRVYRLYRMECLELRHKKPKKRISALRIVPPVPQEPNECWSMDFVSDCLHDGRRFRALTIVDNVSRVSPAIEVGSSLTGYRVVEVLEGLAQSQGLPKVTRLTMGLNSPRRLWMSGLIAEKSSFSSVDQESQRTTRLSRVSMAGSVRNALTRAGLFP